MNIVFLCRRIPPEHGGAGLRISRLAKYLCSKDYNIRFITCTKSRNKQVLLKLLKFKNKNILIMFLETIINFIQLLFILLIHRNKIDLIFCVGGGYSTFSTIFIWKILLKKKIVMQTTIYDSTFDNIEKSSERSPKLKYKIQDSLFRKVDMITHVSEPIYNSYKNCNYSNNKMSIISNAVNDKQFYPISFSEKQNLRRLLLGYRSKEIIFLHVGAIIDRKRIDIIYEIFKKVSAIKKDSKLLLIGPFNTSMGENIKAQILKDSQNCSIDKKIEFLGFKTNVNQYMQLSDIFLFASENEGLPNVILEAMASGLIVFSNIIEGITDTIINDGVNGYLFKNDLLEELFPKICNILEDENKINEISNNALRTIKNKYSSKKNYLQYEDMFKSIIN